MRGIVDAWEKISSYTAKFSLHGLWKTYKFTVLLIVTDWLGTTFPSNELLLARRGQPLPLTWVVANAIFFRNRYQSLLRGQLAANAAPPRVFRMISVKLEVCGGLSLLSRCCGELGSWPARERPEVGEILKKQFAEKLQFFKNNTFLGSLFCNRNRRHQNWIIVHFLQDEKDPAINRCYRSWKIY